MSQPAQSNSETDLKSLPEQVEEAVRNRAVPISHLLRLMSALDADESANENLRVQLRARIGMPLGA
ncbi:hypothetical protein [Methylobacterium oxalidis]|uniref:Uncharacterized protein n=1 Tax=Methylobacterium oxalidis TaxID=944322 RepID=A0A512J472_9HYPH|nr:hypothetical protein [Methylobacterium oxalidis]GEP04754.1 hypothetical protein MOX02_27920 [Methylobacterium oxalidis]GJE30455.1 hypothetical protein LDDCCGHA_0623 [Methylobacterium oxalidis]GLS63580.1 hypothetical protein GCM10007888_19610 [Methylobacterium oxalidis]